MELPKEQKRQVKGAKRFPHGECNKKRVCGRTVKARNKGSTEDFMNRSRGGMGRGVLIQKIHANKMKHFKDI